MKCNGRCKTNLFKQCSYNIINKIKKLKAYCAYYNKEPSNLNFNQIDLTYSNQLVAIKN